MASRRQEMQVHQLSCILHLPDQDYQVMTGVSVGLGVLVATAFVVIFGLYKKKKSAKIRVTPENSSESITEGAPMLFIKNTPPLDPSLEEVAQYGEQVTPENNSESITEGAPVLVDKNTPPLDPTLTELAQYGEQDDISADVIDHQEQPMEQPNDVL